MQHVFLWVLWCCEMDMKDFPQGFWGYTSFFLFIYLFIWSVNEIYINKRQKGHTKVHEYTRASYAMCISLSPEVLQGGYYRFSSNWFCWELYISIYSLLFLVFIRNGVRWCQLAASSSLFSLDELNLASFFSLVKFFVEFSTFPTVSRITGCICSLIFWVLRPLLIFIV